MTENTDPNAQVPAAPAAPAAPAPAAPDAPAAPAAEEPLGAPGLAALQTERDARKKAAAERDALAARLQAIEDRDKTDAQRAADALATATANAERLATENLRLTVLNRHGIPADYADLVHGADEDALEASAKKVQALISAQKPDPAAQVVSALGKPAPASIAGTTNEDRLKAAAASGDKNAEMQLKLLKLGS